MLRKKAVCETAEKDKPVLTGGASEMGRFDRRRSR